MIDAAQHLIDLGFAVFPIHGIQPDGSCTCGREGCNVPDQRGKTLAGKHPSTPHGLKNAAKDLDIFQSFYKQHNNIAIATGPVSSIFVLDVDGMQGESSLDNLASQFGPLPVTLTSYTGKGRHIIFRYPDKKVYTRAGKVAPGLDVRGEGGYIVAPPSKHANGQTYQWVDPDAPIAEAPDWLLALVTRERVVESIPAMTSTLQFADEDRLSIDDVRELLSYLDPDCGHDEWVAIGMALHNEGYPISVWDEWSKRGQKYDPFIIPAKWRSFHQGGGITFGTLVHMAEQSGWKPRIDDEPVELADHPARGFIEKVLAANEGLYGSQVYKPPSHALSNDPVPEWISDQLFDPLKLPGLVGDTVREISQTAQIPQPMLALLNTLAAFGTLFGRRYASPMNTRTNLYTVGVADTGAGKDHSRRFLKDLMVRSGFGDYLGAESIVSGPGILTSLNERISQLMLLDEFGMLLKHMTDEKSSGALRIASKNITELYSSSGNTYNGGQYADAKVKQIRLTNPNLNIYGTTTPNKYAEALSKSAIESGELNRFIILPGETSPTRMRYLGASIASDQLVEVWSQFQPQGLAASNSATIVPEVITVSWSDQEDRIWDMALHQDKMSKDNPLWVRYRENVIKIAMIFAITRDKTVPRISSMDLDLAEAIVTASIHYITQFSLDYMHENQHEANCQSIVRAIKRAGGQLDGTGLYRVTRGMTSVQRREAIDSLIGQDMIVEDVGAMTKAAAASKHGRKRIVYRVV